MKASNSLLLYGLLLLLWTSCSKDKDLTDDDSVITDESVSNLSETPELLLGSWNLTKEDSTSNSEKSDKDCEASNIHFLDNNFFYLSYLDKRIRGKRSFGGLVRTLRNLYQHSHVVQNTWSTGLTYPAGKGDYRFFTSLGNPKSQLDASAKCRKICWGYR